MARKCFFSFHYQPDNWRVSQVRNIGAIEGNKPAKDNDWEEVVGGGDKAIKEWISNQMSGRTCTVILAGENTANRKWINHEIIESWNNGLGILVIYIHNLKNASEEQSSKGKNPLDFITHGSTGKKLSTIAKAYDPPYSVSTNVYNYIAENIEDWIDEAIKIRKDND
ncbi:MULTISPECIES: TIR domain-containing protein [Lelliottia]|uniref:TIR domain-containing protein n=1 Tax=Lelliottia wanjuensis TaxID=3050585 RepID=A0AAP4FWD5_9ENTR|nr:MULTISPECIES: TIR domain-containing protein [unclassified Lelliottia]MDK9356293.1 TIR domain-containing protein [Lelliottia sp. V106_16]MDK9362872.1 TIR domain-containing protein [Lelliottia sp. V106_12]MDK9374703.1 TIR domain-containing protein [Lelliottia sp. V106_10]MDK9583378.1 TIR domain-containing protein [Lelliottia sp. V86_10]MDK9601590.1 TIR domain-containing protein [Lelliottia sp. V106_5]